MCGPSPAKEYNDTALRNLTTAFYSFYKPSIVAVNGTAVGFGANFALFFHDIVVACSEARFKWPFLDLGICPEMGSTLMLPRAVGLNRAKELIYSGDWLLADQAKEDGLIQHIVPKEELVRTALKMAEKFASKPALSLKYTKMLFHQQWAPHTQGLRTTTEAENSAFGVLLKSPEFMQAMLSFSKKHGKKKSSKKAKL